MKKNMLKISGHPDLEDSVANKQILDVLAKRLPEAEIVRLDSLYPDFKIDIPREQERLVKADIIVLQFPVFWYSAPSLLHRWMEETFQHGFSHGSQGDKLSGKKLLLSITAGAPLDTYVEGGFSEHTLEYYMSFLKTACDMTQMKYMGLIATGGVSYGFRTSEERIEEQKRACIVHAERVIERVKEL